MNYVSHFLSFNVSLEFYVMTRLNIQFAFHSTSQHVH